MHYSFLFLRVRSPTDYIEGVLLGLEDFIGNANKAHNAGQTKKVIVLTKKRRMPKRHPSQKYFTKQQEP